MDGRASVSEGVVGSVGTSRKLLETVVGSKTKDGSAQTGREHERNQGTSTHARRR